MSSHTARFGRRTSTGEPHKRRPNACEPCRNSKSRCDGGAPCTQCKKKRGKPLCTYRPQPAGSRAEKDDGETEQHLGMTFHSDTTESSDWNSALSGFHEPENVIPAPSAVLAPAILESEYPLFGAHSLAKCIDEFKLLPVNEDLKPCYDAIAQCQGADVFNISDVETAVAQQEDTLQGTATPHQLPSCSSSLNELPDIQFVPPHLVALHEKAMSLQGLIRRGRLVGAWLELPRLMRQAQLHGLDIDGEHSSGYLMEAEARRRIWWHILEIDVQMSLHIGRPVTIRPTHGITQPMFYDLPTHQRDLEQSRLDFRQYMLDVLDKLSLPEKDKDEFVHHDIFLTRVQLSRLMRLQSRLPPVSFRNSQEPGVAIATADHHLEVYVFKLLLCCRLARSKALSPPGTADTGTKASHSRGRSDLSSPATPKSNRLRSSHRQRPYTYQKDILESARRTLAMFEFIHEVDNSETGRIWTRCFGAYSAASILAIAKLRQETDLETDSQILDRIWKIFQSLSDRVPGSYLFSRAASRLGALVRELHNPPIETNGLTSETTWATDMTMSDNMAPRTPFRRSRKVQSSTIANNTVTPGGKRSHQVPESADGSPHKRQRTLTTELPTGSFFVNSSFPWPAQTQAFEPHLPANHGVLSEMGINGHFTASTYSELYPASGAMSVTASFGESDQNFCHPPMWPCSISSIPPEMHPPMMLYDGWGNTYYQHPPSDTQQIHHDQNGAIGVPPDNQPPSVLLDATEARLSPVNSAFSPPEGNQYPVSISRTPMPGQYQNGEKGEQIPELEFRNETTETIRNPEASQVASQTRSHGSRAETSSSMSVFSARRHSLADVKHNQDVAWNIETPAKWGEERARSKLRQTKDGSRTPIESQSDGSRTPTKPGASKDFFQPQADRFRPRIRSLIPPLAQSGAQRPTSEYQPQVHTHYSRPTSSEGLPQQHVHSQTFGEGGSQAFAPKSTPQFHQHVSEAWAAPAPPFRFNNLSHVHGMHFSANELDRMTQDHQMQPQILATGPYERQQYSTSSWYD